MLGGGKLYSAGNNECLSEYIFQMEYFVECLKQEM